MKVSIEVTSRAEADALKLAMEDPVTRTIAIMNGQLIALPTDRARRRVLRWMLDSWADDTLAGPREQQMSMFRLHDGEGTSGE
jgi:hypothetical protein